MQTGAALFFERVKPSWFAVVDRQTGTGSVPCLVAYCRTRITVDNRQCKTVQTRTTVDERRPASFSECQRSAAQCTMHSAQCRLLAVLHSFIHPCHGIPREIEIYDLCTYTMFRKLRKCHCQAVTRSGHFQWFYVK